MSQPGVNGDSIHLQLLPEAQRSGELKEYAVTVRPRSASLRLRVNPIPAS